MIAAWAAAAPASAQETPTEREAAKDVLQKIAALEASLDVPALMARLAAPSARRESVAARARQLLETEPSAKTVMHRNGEYLQALEKSYLVPKVPDSK
jgi:hypothetical protein